MRYLGDEERFIWTSERDGFRNFYLYSLSGEQMVLAEKRWTTRHPLIKVGTGTGAATASA